MNYGQAKRMNYLKWVYAVLPAVIFAALFTTAHAQVCTHTDLSYQFNYIISRVNGSGNSKTSTIIL